MKLFDKIITIDNLKSIPREEPIGIIYSSDFGVSSDQIIQYVLSLGGIASISFVPNLKTQDKLEIIKNYLEHADEIYSPMLFDACLTLYKAHKIEKSVNEDILDCTFLTFNEIIDFYKCLLPQIKEIDDVLSSIYYIMFFISKFEVKDIRELKKIYPVEYISKKEIPSFIYSLLKDKDFFDIYKLGIINNPVFYTELFEQNYEFISKILYSNKNYHLKTMLELKHNKNLFESFIKRFTNNTSWI